MCIYNRVSRTLMIEMDRTLRSFTPTQCESLALSAQCLMRECPRHMATKCKQLFQELNAEREQPVPRYTKAGRTDQLDKGFIRELPPGAS